jgi:hypothetical protein
MEPPVRDDRFISGAPKLSRKSVKFLLLASEKRARKSVTFFGGEL